MRYINMYFRALFSLIAFAGISWRCCGKVQRVRLLRSALLIGALLLCAPLVACDGGGDAKNLPRYGAASGLRENKIVYKFAVHPLHNPRRLFAGYQPIVDAINAKAATFRVKLVASRDYASFESRLYAGDFEIALPNPLQTLCSLKHGYRVIGKMGDDASFVGLIITRRDSGIATVRDLAGLTMSFPAPTALAATLMPKYFLKSRGLDVEHNPAHYVGSQESAIMNVYLGKTSAAGSWPLPWEQLLRDRPHVGEVLHVQWRTPPMINNGIVARKDVPKEHVALIMDTLVHLKDSEQGRRILGNIYLSCFEECDDDRYRAVKAFLEKYHKLFPEEGFESCQ